MDIEWNNDFLPQIRQGAGIGVVRWTGIVEQRAVDLITSPPKTGRIYKRRGVEHQASAPGEAPANQTGRLLNSRISEFFPEELRGRIMFRTEYAAMLELGTRNMEPRPYARRALAETADDGLAVVIEEIGAALT